MQLEDVYGWLQRVGAILLHGTPARALEAAQAVLQAVSGAVIVARQIPATARACAYELEVTMSPSAAVVTTPSSK